MFNNPLSFGGRIRRVEYIITIVIGIIAIVVAQQIEAVVIALGINIPLSWVLLSQGANEYGPDPRWTAAPQQPNT